MEPEIQDLRERIATLEREAAMKDGVATRAEITELRRDMKYLENRLDSRTWQMMGLAGVAIWITVVLAILFT